MVTMLPLRGVCVEKQLCRSVAGAHAYSTHDGAESSPDWETREGDRCPRVVQSSREREGGAPELDHAWHRRADRERLASLVL